MTLRLELLESLVLSVAVLFRHQTHLYYPVQVYHLKSTQDQTKTYPLHLEPHVRVI